MNKGDSLGDRMKRYENVPKNYLMRRTPAIIRIDGKAFHTFTRGFTKPFDYALIESMQDTMKYLCENIQGCVLGYTQSDEITLVLTDYATITADAWFGYNVEKMCSVASSMATMEFNRRFSERATTQAHTIAVERGAMFDARAFSLPKDEVCNCLIWRQQDAIRNSVQSLGRVSFNNKELDGKSCKNIIEMLYEKHNISWDDLPTECKMGSTCVKRFDNFAVTFYENGNKLSSVNSKYRWVIDNDPPVFKEQRNYVEDLL